MRDMPPEIEPESRTDIPSECCLGGSGIAETIAVRRNDLTMEQRRFAEAIAQALVGAWRRECAPASAISGAVGNQRSY